MDECGSDFATPVLTKVRNESERLKKHHEVSAEPSQAEITTTGEPLPPAPVPSVVLAPDKGRKLVFDNFDFKQHVHNMTEDHQNVDIHWVSHMAVENRVSGNHLSTDKPSIDDLQQLENGLCLPSRHEHHLQRENYITLAERAIVELPCLESLKKVVCKHIPHQYRKEMSEKSEVVRVYMFFLTISNTSTYNLCVIIESHLVLPVSTDASTHAQASGLCTHNILFHLLLFSPILTS